MSKRKLLLADDSITIQKVVNLTFADEGIEVTAVGDGNAAMEKFVENVPDLVMVDVNMPGFDGYKICEIIKQDDETKHIPVILLVGSFEPFDEEEARRVGADDYLTKPFQSIRQLVAKVTGLLDSNGNKNAFGGEAPEADSVESSTDWRQPDDENEIVRTSQTDSLPDEDDTLKFTSVFEEKSFSRTEDNQEFSETSSLVSDDYDDAASGDGKVYDFADGENSAPAAAVYDAPASESDAATPFSHARVEDEIDHRKPSVEPIMDGGDESLTDDTANTDFADVELDEMDLLELPFSEDDEFYDFEDETIEKIALNEDDDDEEENASVERRAAENSYLVDENSNESQLEAQSPEVFSVHPGEVRQPDEPTATLENQSAAEKFSPELIEAIAARVVEKLSDKVIREIAWEVVPQMADLIVQKMTREKLDK